nr:helix-turn-helix domain-containing protein [Allomuricauda sp.]
MNSILVFIIWAALLQGFFLGLVYIFSKRNQSPANTFLGLFLIMIALEALNGILPFNKVGSYTIGEYFTLPDVILFIPLFFLQFVLEKLGTSHKYKSFLQVNYFLAFSITFLTLVNLYLFAFKSSSISQTFDSELVYWTHFGVKFYAFIITSYSFYLSWKETMRYKKLVQNEYSDYALLQINWLKNLIYLLIPVILLWGIALTFAVVTPYLEDLDLAIFGLVAIFLYYLSYQAYIQPNLFERLPESILKTSADASDDGCSVEQSTKIETLMTENEFFLKQDLSLHSFAQAINMSPRMISNCINQNLGQNFNEWVNRFRVNRAKDLLEKDETNRWSIEGIGTEAGFKSRSALYAAFKNEFGCSPGQFRNR